MIRVRLEFPASRYHANPWGRHVNEGVAEWPPSPYRLLRALYDVWQRKCPGLEERMVESLLVKLGSQYPSFSLPCATAAHTRSYLSSNDVDPTDKNLVFDAFLAFGPEAQCDITWPDLALSEEEQNALAELLRNLNYLGRSESWVRAALEHGEETKGYLCEPIAESQADGEATRVACVVPAAEYSGKIRWMDALTMSTSQMSKSKISAPPLLRHAQYLLPKDAIDIDPAAPVRHRPTRVQAMLIGLDSTVLPLSTTAIEVAEQIRVRLMGAHRRIQNGDPTRVSPLFSGKDEYGEKRLDHGHLYILPRSNGKGRIDRVLLLSRRRALEVGEMEAAYLVRELYQSDSRPKVRCVVTWQGGLDDAGIFSQSRVAESVTPFVTARHWRRGRELDQFLEEEIRRECRNHGFPEPREVEMRKRIRGLFDCVEYRRNRKGETPRPGYAFRLCFEKPISTPFSLGYASHFGLGQFASADENRNAKTQRVERAPA